MIAVEIPAALADRPEVVPVDPLLSLTLDPRYTALHVSSLVGQRVALAWRETCPACLRLGMWPCESCSDNGERMVVGWTAEVEAVVPIVDCAADKAHVCVQGHRGLLLHWELSRGTTEDTEVVLDHLRPLADWPPGWYALVLRDARKRTSDFDWFDEFWPLPCRPFSGFAELSEVLAG